MGSRVVENVFWLIWTYLAIGFVWQALEMIFYGEIQPRRVDDIISLLYTGLVVLAYKRGLKHGADKAVLGFICLSSPHEAGGGTNVRWRNR